MFNDYQLDMLARLYARILAWPDPEEEADCSAGSEPQSAGCGDDESAIPIVQQNDAGREEPINQTNS